MPRGTHEVERPIVMSDQRNLILAIVLSVVIILGFQFFYEMPRTREAQQAQRTAATQAARPQAETGSTARPAGPAPAASVAGETVATNAPRVRIDNGRLHGSISLRGARIDQVTLADYHATIDPKSPEIELLSPVGSPHPYFAEFGWVDGSGGAPVPTAETEWKAQGSTVGRGEPVRLSWDNGQGLAFGQKIGLDDNYMFTVERSVTNTGKAPVTLYPYGLLSRWGTPPTLGYYILHEGPIGVLDGKLNEVKYKTLVDKGPVVGDTKGGWFGITDKYWLAALVPEQDEAVKAGFRHETEGDRFQVDFRGAPVVVQPGATVAVTDRLFAGAKEINQLDAYESKFNLPLFDHAVDFGWFYFLTKPIFYTLHWLSGIVGNYGIAILMLTLIIKGLFFPLANKSYKSMSQMKKLQPQVQDLRERHAEDKVRLNQEMMALYKRERVNPMAGCLPMVIQIPVFFSLYKVLFVSLEMRHAPFFGWIHDLSAPDPTTFANLFGLIPWSPPHFLMLGAWPLILGCTMFLQQRLNPQPADPTQARIFMIMPVMFTFLFATFPAGLVIYYSWNNTLSIAQQWLIMKRMGVAT